MTEKRSQPVWLACAVFFLALVTSSSAWSGVVVAATRLVFSESERQLEVNLRATGEIGYLVMGRVLDEAARRSGDMKSRLEGMHILPSAFVIKPGQEKRMLLSLAPGLSLFRDRETLLYLAVTAVPEGDAQENTLQIAVRTWIKLFYRPAALDRVAVPEAVVTLQGDEVVMKNTSAFYVSLFDVTVGGIEQVSPGDIPPFGEKRFPGCGAVGWCDVTWFQADENGQRVEYRTSLKAL